MMDYGSPFDGGSGTEFDTVEQRDLTVTSEPTGSPTGYDSGFGITSTGSSMAEGGVRSPIDARIAASNWSREDVELALRMASVVATIAALYMTYQGGR